MIYAKVFDKIQISLTYFYLDENCWNNKFCWKLCFRHGILVHVSDKITWLNVLFWGKYHYKYHFENVLMAKSKDHFIL